MNNKPKYYLLVILFGIILGTYLHYPAINNPFIIADDVRQSLNWMAYRAPASFKKDIMYDYAKYNRTPVMNLVYKIGSKFIDPLLLGKLFAVFFFSISCLIFYFTGDELDGRTCGILSLLFFSVIFEYFKYSVGGFAHGFMMPFVALTIYGIHKENWKFFLFLMPVEILVYPMAGVFTGFVLVMDILTHDTKFVLKKKNLEN